MVELKLGVVETRFAEIIWHHAPLRSRELVTLCAQEANWKKPTTYSVPRKLCQRGLFQNTDGSVSVLISRDKFRLMQSLHVVGEIFDGTLPAFLAALTVM